LIELAAYNVSANVVFLKGADFNPQPPLSNGESGYVKLHSIEEIEEQNIANFIIQASAHLGWK
jgi:hypothetical protein